MICKSILLAIFCIAVPAITGSHTWWNLQYTDIIGSSTLSQLAAIASNEAARSDRILGNNQQDYYNRVNASEASITQRAEALKTRMANGDASCSKTDDVDALLDRSKADFNAQMQRNIVQEIKANRRVRELYRRFARNAALIQRAADECRRWCRSGRYRSRMKEARKLLIDARQRFEFIVGRGSFPSQRLNAMTMQYITELANLSMQWQLCQNNVSVNPTLPTTDVPPTVPDVSISTNTTDSDVTDEASEVSQSSTSTTTDENPTVFETTSEDTETSFSANSDSSTTNAL